MKITNFIYIPFLLIAIALNSCKPTPKEAADYNDKLMKYQKAVVVKYDELLETYDTYVPSKMDNALIALVDQIENSKKLVLKLETINGGEELKNELLAYLDLYSQIAGDDSEFLIRLYKVPENEFTQEMRVQWDAKYKEIDTKLKAADKKLKEVQTNFANDFNLKINSKS